MVSPEHSDRDQCSKREQIRARPCRSGSRSRPHHEHTPQTVSLGLCGLTAPGLVTGMAAPARLPPRPAPTALGTSGCGWRLAGAARSGAGLGFGNLRPEQSFLSGENGLFPLVPPVGEGLLVAPGDSQAVRWRHPERGQIRHKQNLGDVSFPPSSGEGVTKAAPLDAAREPLSRAAAWGLEVLRSRHLGKHAKNTGSHRAERTCSVQGPPS